MSTVHLSPRLSPREAPRAAPKATRVVRPSAAPVDGFDAGRRATPRARVQLQRGTTGPQVRHLQQRLLARGFMGHRDVASGPGVFGPRTEAAVRRAQSALGLPVTGVAGASTLAALQGDLFRAVNDDTPTLPVSAVQLGARMAQTLTDAEEPTLPMGRRLEEAQAAS